ncbi:MAG: PEP/pyruvate-binding domain-containing protein [Candidatus Levyibacteriota bacterium]
MSNTAPSVIWFADIDTSSHELDRYSRQLAELTQAKFPVPPGFLITDHAYFSFLRENKLDHKVSEILSTISIERTDTLMQGAAHIARLFEKSKLSAELQNELLSFYNHLGGGVRLGLHATGKQPVKHTTLYAGREKQFLKKIKDAWAMMFTEQALWQRHHQEIDHVSTGAVLLVQKHVPWDKSGKVFTIEKQTHAKDTITITQGPDRYLLSKKNLTILDRHLKHNTKTSKLTHNELLAIAKLAKQLERHLYFPQEILWAFSEKKLVLLETKPINTLSERKPEKNPKLPIARGTRVTSTIGTGITKVVHAQSDFPDSTEQHILIVKEARTQDFPKLKKAKGIISESGHTHTEIAMLLREHGIPTVFNVKNATKTFKNDHIITIHGDKGEIYQGGF